MSKDKIDFVILWVDDQDDTWRRKKEHWEKQVGIKRTDPERYRSWDNLHYLFRGIEKYASWVNHVYLVTDSQIPSWLDSNHPKVSVIDHTDIIEEKYLPTFNSQAIELCLHRIPGLSENFVYFNDDMFILKEMKPQDFFKNKLPRHAVSLNSIMPQKDDMISSVVFNNMTIINDKFDKKQTLKKSPFKWLNYRYGIENIRTLLMLPWPYYSSFKQPHLTGVFKKTTYQKVWEEYGFQLEKTLRSRFRDYHNHNQWLFRDWQIASNQYEPQTFKIGKVFQLSNNHSVRECSRHILNQKSKIVCVNDTENLRDFEKAKKEINGAFSQIFPAKSSFEK